MSIDLRAIRRFSLLTASVCGGIARQIQGDLGRQTSGSFARPFPVR